MGISPHTTLDLIGGGMVLLLLGQIHLSRRLRKVMATLADIQAKVAAETTVEQSAITLLQELSQQLKDALANGADPATLQAIADNLDQNNANLAAAITANTPAAPQS